jgi:hypothetical protein
MDCLDLVGYNTYEVSLSLLHHLAYIAHFALLAIDAQQIQTVRLIDEGNLGVTSSWFKGKERPKPSSLLRRHTEKTTRLMAPTSGLPSRSTETTSP